MSNIFFPKSFRKFLNYASAQIEAILKLFRLYSNVEDNSTLQLAF